MAAMGIYPYKFMASPLNWLQLLSPYLMVTSLIVCIVLSTMYVYQGWTSTSLSFLLYACINVIGESQSLFAYLNMRRKMDSVGRVHLKLQEIADQGKIPQF